MKKKSSSSKEAIHQDAVELKQLLREKSDREKIDNLYKHAESGISLKSWANRLVFGYSVSDAIERWLSSFEPSREKPLNEQIPVEETQDVVAAWMRYSFLRAVFIFLLSSSITAITAYFLYKQNIKQDELIQSQREIDNREKRYLYLKTLFDQDCENKIESEDRCMPIENGRVRAEAAQAYVAILTNDKSVEKIDLSFAHLSETNLRNFNNQGNRKILDLFKADMSSSVFTNADLSNSNLIWAELSESSLVNANLSSARLNEAGFTLANMQGTILTGADVERSVFLSAINLTCEQLKSAVNWEASYRDPGLACGAGIPKYTGYVDASAE